MNFFFLSMTIIYKKKLFQFKFDDSIGVNHDIVV